MTFTVCIKTSTLTKTTHYTGYQQKLFDEIKRLKEVEGYGYKRISYILFEKGYRSIRTDSILRYNYIYSIYKKGKIREKRINREFKPTVKDIMVYHSLQSNFINFVFASRTQLRTNRHTRCTVVWNVGNSTKKSSNQFLSCCSYLTFKNNNYGKIQWRSNF